MSENWWQCEVYIVINDKSQGKHLSFDGLLHYTFIVQFAGERVFRISEHLAKLQAKWLIASHAPFPLIQFYLFSTMQSRQICKVTCAGYYRQERLLIVVVLISILT